VWFLKGFGRLLFKRYKFRLDNFCLNFLHFLFKLICLDDLFVKVNLLLFLLLFQLLKLFRTLFEIFLKGGVALRWLFILLLSKRWLRSWRCCWCFLVSYWKWSSNLICNIHFWRQIINHFVNLAFSSFELEFQVLKIVNFILFRLILRKSKLLLLKNGLKFLHWFRQGFISFLFLLKLCFLFRWFNNRLLCRFWRCLCWCGIRLLSLSIELIQLFLALFSSSRKCLILLSSVFIRCWCSFSSIHRFYCFTSRFGCRSHWFFIFISYSYGSKLGMLLDQLHRLLMVGFLILDSILLIEYFFEVCFRLMFGLASFLNHRLRFVQLIKTDML